MPGIIDSTEVPFHYKGSINHHQMTQDSANQASRRWMSHKQQSGNNGNNVKIMYYDPHGHLVE